MFRGFNHPLQSFAIHRQSWILLILLISIAWPIRFLVGQDSAKADSEPTVRFTLQRSVAHRGFDGESCWVHARAGLLLGDSANERIENERIEQPTVIMTMQKLQLSGSDVFYELNATRSDDLGATWSIPEPQKPFQRQVVSADANAPLPQGAEIAPELVQAGDETTVCDFTPQWHAASGRLLGIGQTVWYRDNRVMKVRPRGIAYAVYDANQHRWGQWATVQLPQEPKFLNAGAGSVQRIDLPGGDVLIPIYFKTPEQQQYSVTVCRCRFDGKNLFFLRHGNELTVPVKRGLYEPSLTFFQGRYYLTMRNDDHGYVSVSDDGLNFAQPVRWTFDDGKELGNYNTQQHWVTHSDALFLVYTRRGLNNDHVFRHRAPLMIAAVDADRLQVIRASEQIVVPERGARLGNFGVVDVSENETWITAAEWMQPQGVEQHGSDNSIFVAKLKWDRPNRRLSSQVAETPAASADPDASEATERSEANRLVGPLDKSPPQIIDGYAQPPLLYRDDFGDYRSPLIFADGSRAETPEQWQRRRQEILDQWQQHLGIWPEIDPHPEMEIIESQRRENFTQHRIRFAWTPNETTEGYLLVPEGEGRRAAVVSVYYEPETAIGLGSPNRDYALQLVRRGFVTLSLGTTEATAAKTYGLYYPNLQQARVQPLSMLAYAAATAWHLLANRPEVDRDRIGIVGHSFGGKWAMFAACLYDKYACAVWSDPGIVFDESRPSVNYWEPWYLGYHPKPWRQRGVISDANPARGLYNQLRAEGRDLHELHALMAPRPFLVSGGSEDPVHRWQALNHAVEVNRILGQANRVMMTNRPEHGPNADSNAVIYAFFEQFIGG